MNSPKSTLNNEQNHSALLQITTNKLPISHHESMPSKPLLLFILLIILPLTLSQPPPAPPTTTPNQEQQLLLQIKKDWGNPPALTSWTTSTPHCNWTGILCTSGAVTQLNLTDQNILNAIPSTLCQLPKLSVIDLSYNYIPGMFPTHLYNCTNLRHLDISQNYFVGPIPSDIDRLSHHLTYLSLSANDFSGDIPASVGNLTNLQYLLLDNNGFSGTFPNEIGNLSNLLRLYLANNAFVPRQIPEEFAKLTKLEWLWMTQTNVHGEIPVSLGNLKNLVVLSLDQNSLSGSIPPGIWMLEKLEKLYLWHNHLTGEINATTIGATSLVELDVSINNLTGHIPEGFGNLKNLGVLHLDFNKLTGEIPASIGLLPLLYDIRFFSNNLTGALPPELGKHSRLWNFEVNDNQLSGELPQFLCAGGNFIYLGAFHNNFTGNLPSSLGNCPTLIDIDVHGNNLKGEIPAGIWTSLNLQTVIISHNSFSGTLPEKLPANLTRLEVESNQLSGNIPSAAQNLAVFKGSNNLFSGGLPKNLAQFSSLQTLLLEGNQISGAIPDSISALRHLTKLNMSRNHLSGEIPASVGSLPVLTILDLSDNQLTGAIPAQMGNLHFIALNLSSNDLSGELPALLQNPAYDESFLSNPNLCSSTTLSNLRVCSNQPSRSNYLSTGLLVLFIVLGVIFFIGAAVLGVFLLMGRKRTKSDDRGRAPWKLTSFHAVEFNESNIEKGLTDDNLIGSGGAGLVYKIALGNPAGDIVAVKKIWNSRKLDSKLEKEFEAEVEILGTIRHANIVKLLCCISSSDSKLLVYEYMENGSLDRWLHARRRAVGPPMGRLGSGRSNALDWPTRLAIATGAAKGLCYMHHDCSSSIVHRDVKSSNILLDSELNAKIADFGLARMLVKSGEPESVSAIAGSFGYMAPECQWLRKVNEKVDVYSFGVVLLELTTGREPNGEDSCLADYVWHHIQEGGTIEDIIDEEIRDPSYIEEIGLVLQLGIICTGTSPANRPSMKEALQVLQRCNQMVENGWVKPLGFGEFDAAPLLRNKRGSGRKRTSEVAQDDDDDDSYV